MAQHELRQQGFMTGIDKVLAKKKKHGIEQYKKRVAQSQQQQEENKILTDTARDALELK